MIISKIFGCSVLRANKNRQNEFSSKGRAVASPTQSGKGGEKIFQVGSNIYHLFFNFDNSSSVITFFVMQNNAQSQVVL